MKIQNGQRQGSLKAGGGSDAPSPGDSTTAAPLGTLAAFQGLLGTDSLSLEGSTPGASNPAPAEAVAPPPAPATYQVLAGDSLSAIAQATLGDANRWLEIYQLNTGVVGPNPDLILPGQVLTLPGAATPATPFANSSPAAPPVAEPTPEPALPNPPQPEAPTPAPAPPSPPQAPAPAPAPSGKTYAVAAGDSLATIARNQLGAANRWPEIYQLNRDRIGGNPNVIVPGTVLNLPETASPAPAHPSAGRPQEAYSKLPIRRDLLPGAPAMPDRSDIPGYAHLQCGEFAYKYFHAQGKPYPTQGQPYNFLMTGVPYPETTPVRDYQRNLNGGTTPPRAGDILVAKGPASGEYHTAVVTQVDDAGVHVIQANVPYGTQGEVEAVFPMKYENGRYTMPDLPTSTKGYNHDFAVAGWIHPTGEAALPGAS